VSGLLVVLAMYVAFVGNVHVGEMNLHSGLGNRPGDCGILV